jgi:hypothetical protein
MPKHLHDFMNPDRSFIHCYIILVVLSQPPTICPNPTVFSAVKFLSVQKDGAHLSEDELSPTADASDVKRKKVALYAEFRYFQPTSVSCHILITDPNELVKLENNPKRMAGPRTTLIYGKNMGHYQ